MKLRDRILNAQDIKEELTRVPEWDGLADDGVTPEECNILVRGLTGKQRAGLLQGAINITTGSVDLSKMYPDLVILTSYDPIDKTSIFVSTDRDAVAGKSGAVIDKLAAVAMRLSGMAPNSVKDATKNSVSTQNVDSTLN